MISFGTRVQYLRKNKNFTQKELAEICGVSAKAISRYENDTAEPDFEMMKKIASTFDTDINTLIGYENKNKKIHKNDLLISKREMEIILAYRKCSKEKQKSIRLFIEIISEGEKNYPKSNTKVSLIHEKE
ncbi:MAG: helix-turn-helix domain-containing protein [Anaerorhabdus sp.]|uniref:helix-turn-helix domain-containing protein n=1 Tax=Anaerorhabdus sp. TaxID=1872524 RepID=UPI003A8B6214